jgi:DNA topoisomerase III
VDPDQKVRRGNDTWEQPYVLQLRHKQKQLEAMSRFLDDRGCRQLALLAHFGDDDKRGACGMCDACAPQNCRVRKSRELSADEEKWLSLIVDKLRRAGKNGMSTGKLYKETLERLGVDRKTCEHMVTALARSHRVRLEDAVFTNEKGERIAWTRVTLVGEQGVPSGLSVFVPERSEGGGRKKRREPRAPKVVEMPEAPREVVDRLKAFRLVEAQRRKVPAFNIFTDRALLGIAASGATSKDDLRGVPGVGPRVVEKYGEALLHLLNETG